MTFGMLVINDNLGFFYKHFTEVSSALSFLHVRNKAGEIN